MAALSLQNNENSSNSGLEEVREFERTRTKKTTTIVK